MSFVFVVVFKISAAPVSDGLFSTRILGAQVANEVSYSFFINESGGIY